jgi:hypothetical protein
VEQGLKVKDKQDSEGKVEQGSKVKDKQDSQGRVEQGSKDSRTKL